MLEYLIYKNLKLNLTTHLKIAKNIKINDYIILFIYVRAIKIDKKLSFISYSYLIIHKHAIEKTYFVIHFPVNRKINSQVSNDNFLCHNYHNYLNYLEYFIVPVIWQKAVHRYMQINQTVNKGSSLSKQCWSLFLFIFCAQHKKKSLKKSLFHVMRRASG